MVEDGWRRDGKNISIHNLYILHNLHIYIYVDKHVHEFMFFNHLQPSSTIFNQLDILFFRHISGSMWFSDSAIRCASHPGDDRSEGLGHVSHGFQDPPGTYSRGEHVNVLRYLEMSWASPNKQISKNDVQNRWNKTEIRLMMWGNFGSKKPNKAYEWWEETIKVRWTVITYQTSPSFTSIVWPYGFELGCLGNILRKMECCECWMKCGRVTACGPWKNTRSFPLGKC